MNFVVKPDCLSSQLGMVGAGTLLAALMGCTVGSDYQRPDPFQGALSEESTWREVPEMEFLPEEAERTQVSQVDWWRQWNEPELTQWIELALEKSPTLDQAKSRIQEARAGRLSARSRWLPGLNMYGDAVRNRLSENGVGAGSAAAAAGLVNFENDFYQTGFDASWEIDVFGGTRRAVQASQARLESSEAQLEAARLTLIGEVARAWFDWRRLQAQLILQQNQLTALNSRQQIWNRKLELGLCNEIEVQRRLAELRSAEAETPLLLASARAAQYQLMRLVGLPANQPLPDFSREYFVGIMPDANGSVLSNLETDSTDSGARLKSATGEAPGFPDNPGQPSTGTPATWLLRRPDLMAAERELAAATADIGVAKAEWYPKFYLSGVAGLESGSLSDLFTAQSRTWTLGPGIRWSLFQGGRIRAGIRRSQARAEQALARYKETGLIAITEVEMGRAAVAGERASVEKMKEAERSSKAAWEKSVALQKSGLIDPAQVPELELEWLGMKRKKVDAVHREALALVGLYKSLGGGWEIICAPSDAFEN